MFQDVKKFILGLCVISGTIVGVGIFSLPYIASQVGFPLLVFYFFALGAMLIILHYFFGKLALQTPDSKRLPGFAEIYLGKRGKAIALFSTMFGFLGSILAYLIVGGQFLEELLSSCLGGGNLFWTLVYFSAGALLIFFGIKAVSKIEFWGLVSFFLALIFIYLRAKNYIVVENLGLEKKLSQLNFKEIFLPYGPVLFSLWGATLIPEVEEMLKGRKRLLKYILPFSIIIPILIYIFFVYLILGITGPQTTTSALVGLKNFLGKGTVSILLFLGVVATFTSFVSLGLTLKKVFWYDLKINKNIACFVTCFFPLVLFLLGIKRFIPIISFVGGITLGINGILILLMYRKIKPGNLLVYPLILILFGGIIYEIIYFLA